VWGTERSQQNANADAGRRCVGARDRRGARRVIVTLAALVPLAFAIASCGGSSSTSPESAHASACNAMTDIQAQINGLQSYTRSKVTSDDVKGNLDAIGADLQTIDDSIPDQAPSLQKKLEVAAKGFRNKLGDSLTDVEGQTKAAQNSPGGPQQAFTRFATFYIQTFGFVPCGGAKG